MLKLHRLELSGFKSFVDPVSLEFAGGITSIVGPNGCGKSNVSDAVCWVLGERSAKSLRGATMEDVIFNGSASRRPLGMAEVTLELITDPGFEAAVEGRLTIGRQLHRDGESHYLLNGKRTRLKDVKDLLMDTGLGVRAYSVIEQGRIGMILSGKPHERRRLLEEAAGITHYKERRRVTEVKLEEARANLARLDDIVSEVERSLRSLKRQAGSARRYKARQAEYQELLRAVLEGRRTKLHGRLAELAARIAEQVAAEAGLTAELHRQEADLAERREQADTLAAALSDRHRRGAELAARIEGKQEFLKGSRTRLEEIAERRESGERAAQARGHRMGELGTQRDELGRRRQGLIAERDQEASAVNADEGRIQEIEASVGEAEGQLEAFRNRLLSSIGNLNGLRNRLHSEQLEREKGDLRRRHLAEELSQKVVDCEEATREEAATGEKAGDLERRRDARRERLEALTGELSGLLAEQQTADLELVDLEARLRLLHQRREVLTELGRAHEEQRERVKESLAEAGLERPEFLAERLRIPEGWERSVDLYLGELADAVLLPPGTDGLDLARALASGRGTGRLLSPIEGPTNPSPISDPAIERPLGAALGLPPQLAAALPPAYLVTSRTDAERLARLHPGVAFLCRDRLWAQSGLLHVRGEEAKPGLLAREHELAKVTNALEPLEEARTRLVAARSEREKSIEQARARAGELETDLAAIRQELAVAAARYEDAAARRRRLDVERDTLETEQIEVGRELGLVGDRATRVAAELARSEALHVELEATFDEAQKQVERSRESREAARTTGASRKGRLELLQERLDAHDQETARLEGEIAEGRRLLELWEEDRDSLERREAEIRQAMQAAEKELQEALEKRAASEGDARGEQEKLEAERAELKTLAGQLEARRQERDQTRATVSDLRVEQATVQQESKDLEADFQEAFGAAETDLSSTTPDADPARPATVPADGSPLAEVGSAAARATPPPSTPPEPPAPPTIDTSRPLAELETDLARCKQILERLGPVNLLAAEEYAEQEERHTFLTEQRADVRSSVERLRRTIQEIDKTSSARFRETFTNVNRHFGATFVQLFGGGEAEMRLMDEDDLLETGIEILARPPGKRLQNIMLLSGGEKALTAIALLFALFETKPSPFCILDEVDAPLDDVNTLRFAEMLKRMSSETQFIVITHNKLTMEAASTLYGVTMQERGVSNLVSVELDEIQPLPAAEAQTQSA